VRTRCSGPRTKIQRASLWTLLVLALLLFALILFPGPDDGWDYFGLLVWGAVFLNAAYELIKDRRKRTCTPLPM
jgi:hypothetical protein